METKIQQYLDGKLSQKEQRELLHWLRSTDNKPTFNTVKKTWWAQQSALADRTAPDSGQLRLSNRLKEKYQIERTSRYLIFYKYAAAVLLLIGLGGGLFFSRSYLRTSELKYTEIHTDSGQISGITLPDGSKVWINSGTRLSYNNQFGINNRDIKVNGEAFFSVAKNEQIPFRVDLETLTVEVTGTQFEVSNYDDSGTMRVVLEKGSVDIHSKNNKLLMHLLPDEMASFDKETMTIEKEKIIPEHYTSWRNGIIHIFELPLEQVVMKLEKRFNQKFEVDSAIKDLPFTFSIEKESLSDVLYLLERISPVNAVQEGNIIRLKYKNTN